MITPVPTRPRPIVRASRGPRQAKIASTTTSASDVQQPQHVDEALVSRSAAELVRREEALHVEGRRRRAPTERSSATGARPRRARTCDKRLPLPAARCASPSSPTFTLTRRRWTRCSRRSTARRVDAVWCLGDVVGYGPRRTMLRASSPQRADVCLVGNHDLVALGELDLANSTTTRRPPRSGRGPS